MKNVCVLVGSKVPLVILGLNFNVTTVASQISRRDMELHRHFSRFSPVKLWCEKRVANCLSCRFVEGEVTREAETIHNLCLRRITYANIYPICNEHVRMYHSQISMWDFEMWYAHLDFINVFICYAFSYTLNEKWFSIQFYSRIPFP